MTDAHTASHHTETHEVDEFEFATRAEVSDAFEPPPPTLRDVSSHTHPSRTRASTTEQSPSPLELAITGLVDSFYSAGWTGNEVDNMSALFEPRTPESTMATMTPAPGTSVARSLSLSNDAHGGCGGGGDDDDDNADDGDDGEHDSGNTLRGDRLASSAFQNDENHDATSVASVATSERGFAGYLASSEYLRRASEHSSI